MRALFEINMVLHRTGVNALTVLQIACVVFKVRRESPKGLLDGPTRSIAGALRCSSARKFTWRLETDFYEAFHWFKGSTPYINKAKLQNFHNLELSASFVYFTAIDLEREKRKIN